MADRAHRSHRERSGSPRRDQHRPRPTHHSRRSRSPRREGSKERPHTHRQHHRSFRPSQPVAAELPFNARHLTKHDFKTFKPMFALYLDIQKQKDLWSMDETEARGRWKSFTGKWNAGTLSEGWYDPGTFQRAVENAAEEAADQAPARKVGEDEYGRGKQRGRGQPGWKSEAAETEELDEGRPVRTKHDDAEDSESDESIGPALPGQDEQLVRSKRAGPSIPNMEDLELKRENETEEAFARRKVAHEDRKWERKAERNAQKERLEELVPRAAAGTRERQLEKKREVNEKMKGFRDKGDGVAEVPDEELMGGGGGVGELKQKMSEYERKKTEREVRREEINRARNAEREERLSEYREKEDKTMEMLRNLARQNFGPRAG